MTNNFWQNITSPNFSLAPMEDVTDTVFREIVLQSAEQDKLHLLFSEFTSVEGMCHPIGHDKVIHRLQVNQSELQLLKEKNVKLIAQIWGKDPEKYYKAAQFISQETPFHGIDINMGCPVKNVVKAGCCSALIDQPELTKEIILATKEGSSLPVSVKTRIGFKKVVTQEWITHLLQLPIAALTLHGRIQKQMSEGVADWNEIAKAVQIRNSISPSVKLIGNGDVESYAEGIEKCKKYGVDGVMIGRGIFKNPWFFSPSMQDIDKNTKLKLLLAHTQLYQKTWNQQKNFSILKRFYKIYTNGFEGASALRNELMSCNCAEEVVKKIYQICDF